jgi:hypothetical protein
MLPLSGLELDPFSPWVGMWTSWFVLAMQTIMILMGHAVYCLKTFEIWGRKINIHLKINNNNNIIIIIIIIIWRTRNLCSIDLGLVNLPVSPFCFLIRALWESIVIVKKSISKFRISTDLHVLNYTWIRKKSFWNAVYVYVCMYLRPCPSDRLFPSGCRVSLL